MVLKLSDTAHIKVALLTGGGDRPYALGLVESLTATGASVDFIGSDHLDVPALHTNQLIRFLNLRGATPDRTSLATKVARVLLYYWRLIRYVTASEPRVFHILWNNKFELFDRTVLMLYYRLCRKRVVLTVHNVNAAERDGNDGPLNRTTLKAQYHLADHLIVHTLQMRAALQDKFGVDGRKVTVVPFGINETTPNTELTGAQARRKLGLNPSQPIVLFFGNIAQYKGVEYLIEAMTLVEARLPDVRLVVAGRIKEAEQYWASIERRIADAGLDSRVVLRIGYVPDAETEVYFKAADVLVLPYTHVFQSGVLFLAFNFGLPVIATDVGALKEDVIEGVTGYVCEPRSARSLARAIMRYFDSGLYSTLPERRQAIRRLAQERHSWAEVARITKEVYDALDPGSAARVSLDKGSASAPFPNDSNSRGGPPDS